jgi:hypothetical protein
VFDKCQARPEDGAFDLLCTHESILARTARVSELEILR